MKTITVAAVAGRNTPGHVEAMGRTFGCLPVPLRRETTLFAPTEYDNGHRLKWQPIPDWGDDYRYASCQLSRFILHVLPRYIDTDYVIIVQADGYAVNRDAWTDEFLEYDYIGAPLPCWETLCIKGRWHRRVGSGGFCLRSRRFLELSARLPYDGTVGEDICVSRIKHRYFEQFGCRFAPVPLALRWCYEHRLEDYPRWNPLDSFGQHGLALNGQPLHTLAPWRAFLNAYKRRRTRQRFHNEPLHATL